MDVVPLYSQMSCIMDVAIGKSQQGFANRRKWRRAPVVWAVVGGVVSGNALLSAALCRGFNMLLKQSGTAGLFLNESDIISGEDGGEKVKTDVKFSGNIAAQLALNLLH